MIYVAAIFVILLQAIFLNVFRKYREHGDFETVISFIGTLAMIALEVWLIGNALTHLME